MATHKGTLISFRSYIPSLSVVIFFLVVIDYIMSKAMSQAHFGIIWQEKKSTDLDFAKDVTLLTIECRLSKCSNDCLVK